MKTLIIATAVTALALGGSTGVAHAGDVGALQLSVDSTVRPSVDAVVPTAGVEPQPVAAVATADGPLTEFIADELVVATNDDAQLAALLDRWHGVELASYDPARYGDERVPVVHLVRVDASVDEPDPGAVAARLVELGPAAGGALRVSSWGALALLDIATQEAAAGVPVGLNFVSQSYAAGNGLRWRNAIDAPTAPTIPGYNPNPFTWNHLNISGLPGVGVSEAWSILARLGALPPPTPIPLAILDAGFTLDPDLPSGTVDSLATNPTPCSGGVACPFHGTNVASAAAAIPNNGFGGAGPGGPVTTLQRIFTAGTSFDAGNSILKAAAAGSRILNMSFGGAITAALSGLIQPLPTITASAASGGALEFAAAGNTGTNVDAMSCFLGGCWESTLFWPCELGGVVCVGALAPASLTAAAFSNFGTTGGSGSVQLWAPGTVFVGPDPTTPGNIAQTFSGTSASSPYAAGSAALVWSTNAAASAGSVLATLLATGRPNAGHAGLDLDVRAAVRAAIGGDEPPEVEVTVPANGMWIPRGAVTVQANALDRESTPTVSWFVDGTPTGISGATATLPLFAFSFGTHTITARAVDSVGHALTDSNTVTLYNTPPTVTITSPASGSTFYYGKSFYGWWGNTISFAGTSYDPNNDPSALPATDVHWYLDQQSTPFATGYSASLSALGLSDGTHTVGFSGTDGTYSASASVSFTVAYWWPRPCCTLVQP